MSFKKLVIFVMAGLFTLPCQAEVQSVAATEPTMVQAAADIAMPEFFSVSQNTNIRPVAHQRWEQTGHDILHNIAGDDVHAFLGFRPHIRFIASPTVHASVSDSGTLYLTSGILEQIHDQSEYAFILAHEVAHVLLGHHHQGAQRRSRDHLVHEIAADELALKLLNEGGYDSSAAHRFLTRIGSFGSESGLPLSQLHPGLLTRIRALQSSELAYQ